MRKYICGSEKMFYFFFCLVVVQRVQYVAQVQYLYAKHSDTLESFFQNSNYHFSYKIIVFFKKMRLDQNYSMSIHSSFLLPHSCVTFIKLYIHVQTCLLKWTWTVDGFKITNIVSHCKDTALSLQWLVVCSF